MILFLILIGYVTGIYAIGDFYYENGIKLKIISTRSFTILIRVILLIIYQTQKKPNPIFFEQFENNSITNLVDLSNVLKLWEQTINDLADSYHSYNVDVGAITGEIAKKIIT